jgi:lipoyl(octanoyl) transferase
MAKALVAQLGTVPYAEAWELQRTIARDVAEGTLPDTVLFLEHPPVLTLGRRTDPAELHVPPGAEVEIVETDRGGKSTYHGPGQLVCYPILDLNRHGRDVKKYCRDLEETVIRAVAPLGIEATRIEGLTGVWLERRPSPHGVPLASVPSGDSASSTERRQRRERSAEPGFARREPSAAGSAGPPRKIASIGVHISRWITTHGYALNVDLDPAPFTRWITACGLEDAAFTTIARELGRAVSVDEVRSLAAAAFADVFDLELDPLEAPILASA